MNPSDLRMAAVFCALFIKEVDNELTLGASPDRRIECTAHLIASLENLDYLGSILNTQPADVTRFN